MPHLAKIPEVPPPVELAVAEATMLKAWRTSGQVADIVGGVTFSLPDIHLLRLGVGIQAAVVLDDTGTDEMPVSKQYFIKGTATERFDTKKPNKSNLPKSSEPQTFEDMLTDFTKKSNDKLILIVI